MLVVGLSPMLAPTIGGYVTAAYGWHVVFLILMGIGIVVLLASHFGFATYARTRYFDFVETKTNYS
jgi:MFS family permease